MAQFFPGLRTRRSLAVHLIAGTGWVLAGCQPAPLPNQPQLPRHDVIAFVVTDDWHTDIVLPTGAVTGPLQIMKREFPTARYLQFGWGERDYYMARQPTAGVALHALFPSPAVLLVTALDRPPVGSQVFTIGFSAAGFARLEDYLSAAFDRAAGAMPRRLASGPQPASAFYAATGTYSATYTCNTWAADALHAGGIPVNSAGVIFASQLADQVQPLSDQRGHADCRQGEMSCAQH